MKPNRIILVLLCIVFGYFTLKSLAEKFGKFATKNEDERQTSYNNQQTHATAHSNVVLLSMSGNGTKNSDNFYANGNRCRVEFSYKNDNNFIGIFYVYLVGADKEIEKTGGFPFLDQNESINNGITYIHPTEGYYYLKVSSMGKYTLKIIQE